ncbi:MAG: SCP2 sterol-binding domain-containing protein [Aquihabitans sp.]
MAKFLSEDWLGKAKAIHAEYEGQGGAPPPMRMNLIITEVPSDVSDAPIDAHMNTSEGNLDMDLGHIDPSDLTVTLEYETAKAILVEANPQAGMQAFMGGKIKVQGDMTKLMAMQTVNPDPKAKEMAERLNAITD